MTEKPKPNFLYYLVPFVCIKVDSEVKESIKPFKEFLKENKSNKTDKPSASLSELRKGYAQKKIPISFT